LEDVHLEINPGEFWFFLGPNGAGKTTLLKAFLAEIRPQQGRILTDAGLYQRHNLGFVPQRCDLNPTLSTTVREFVWLGLVGLRTNRQERESRLIWALDQMGLGGMSSRNYWSLSGGERQRALVARALVRRPRILFLDEPTRGLDLAAEEAVLQTLTDLNRRELLTVLFVTHDLTLAARYASHVALFHNGKVQGGPLTDILTPDRLYFTYGLAVSVYQEAPGQVTISMGRGN
jgi:ABC-type cobalamin/Fe3+-siderophores transport system ATPase subunit